MGQSSKGPSEGLQAPGCIRIRIDTCVRHINAAFSACQVYMQCKSCCKESYSLLLTASLFQLLSRVWGHMVDEIQRSEGGMEVGHLSCRVGEYEVSHDEAVAIRSLLVRRSLQRGQEVLANLRSLIMSEGGMAEAVEGRGPSHSPVGNCEARSYEGTATHRTRFSAVDAEYLREVVCRSEAGIAMLLGRFPGNS